jgi:hypothetical protein
VPRTVALRWCVLGAAAVFAAALGDFVVERIADTGIFGAGYVDHDQSAVGTAIVLAIGIVLAVVLRRCATLLGAAGIRRRAAWRRVTMRALAPRAVARALPLIVAAQLVGVYAIEAAERLALGAPLPDGLVWLGAPVVIALALHALFAIGCAFVVSAALRALLTWCAALVAVVLALVVTALGAAAAACLGARVDPPLAGGRNHRARERGERAPPLLLTPA